MDRRPGKEQARPALGVAWYTEEEWGQVKAAATDPERFEATYGEWCAMATKAVAGLEAAGVSPVRIFVTIHELLSWCLLKDRPNDAFSRAQFVSETLSRRNRVGA